MQQKLMHWVCFAVDRLRVDFMLARLTLGLAALFCASCALAEDKKGNWIADPKSGCKVWEVNPVPNAAISWSGGCTNGFAQGRGALQWFENGKPSDRYEGGMASGKINGRGVFTGADGDRYEGEWRDHKANGRGVYTWGNGERYEGEWRDHLPNGYGTAIVGGQTFTGNWTNGCFQQGNRRSFVATTKEACGFK
jgi:hypothetical protein